MNRPPAIELDCRQMRCPLPVIELASAFGQLAIGDTIAVAATDATAEFDIPAWCRMRGQEYLGRDTAADGTARYLVRRIS
jgi:tRNA 2-thiouridine synthesizing protein A